MPRRILVAEESRHIVTALRRDLEGTGFRVEAFPPAQAADHLDPEKHVAAIVRGGATAGLVIETLRRADPSLPVIALFFDEEEADRYPDAFGADGILVGPLTAPAVKGACLMAERLRQRIREVAGLERRVAELEAGALQRGSGERDLEFLKKLLLLEVKRSKRYGFPISLALVSVDRWEELSKALPARERAALLAEVLGALTGGVRDIDIAVPFAEERFIVLMPHTRAEGAVLVARRLCARVRERAGTPAITASAGVAGHDGDGSVSFGGLVKRAAEALTRARNDGGDQAVSAEPAKRRDRISIG